MQSFRDAGGVPVPSASRYSELEPTPQALQQRLRWLERILLGENIRPLVLFGPAQSGKSTFFRHLPCGEADSALRYRYWNLLGHRSATSAATFWSIVGELLEVDPLPVGPKGVEALMEALDKDDQRSRKVLILDNWDEAREFGDGRVHIDSLRLLTGATRHHLNTTNPDGDVPRRQALLSIIAVTQFPNKRLLLEHARRTFNPGWIEVSEFMMSRSARHERWPWLDETGVMELLQAVGVKDEGTRQSIYLDCGGWDGLLVVAAEICAERGGYDRAARSLLREQVRSILHAPLIHPVMKNHSLSDERRAWSHIVAAIQEDVSLAANYCLPIDDGRLVPILSELYAEGGT